MLKFIYSEKATQSIENLRTLPLCNVKKNREKFSKSSLWPYRNIRTLRKEIFRHEDIANSDRPPISIF